ncbi:P-loop containing nucleoside triphosphate hydrolase protein [Pisolithus orientalis]|uniref:P-loop containing nucleoside triphosphate hydrolase protein n=1 Tax=Pisolithus orientalis TaxID=936130 RepID=UPI0022257A06|nr:P-loop containing nucleoside triphosphate hydrolase protein [Pisolithus orientalis]KAI6032901.1 P-loop containing nucleoside triphosphate hydrolase protein [Pisolithus orientalis]
MTTLRDFQAEIQQAQSRALTKQRAQGATVETNVDWRSADRATTSAGGSLQSQTVDATSSVEEDDILNFLLGGDYESARNSLASLLTRQRGEYIFRIGVRSPTSTLFSGEPLDNASGWTGVSLTEDHIGNAILGVEKVVEEIGAKVSVLFRAGGLHPRAAILLRLPPLDIALTPEVRCAVVGNVDSGKSTTLGVLTRGTLDDGRGRARVALFRHKHELETGRTSSVGMEILGFTVSGIPVLPGRIEGQGPGTVRIDRLGWEDIAAQSAKIISFSDLAGHERYLKTTLYGLTSGAPSCVILMVGGNAGFIGMSKEHLAITLALNVPVIVCVTKIDMTPPNVLSETLKQVTKVLKSPGCRKTPVLVKSTEIVIELAQVFAQNKICPIFKLSNVTGEGLDYLRTFLNLLPPSEHDSEAFAVDQPLEYSITEVWSVPYVGTVVNGILNNGRVKTGDAILFGPDANGHFQSTVIRSMQRKRADVFSAEAGQCVSLALKRVKRVSVRKGMVIVHKSDAPPGATRRFEGQVLVLYHNTTMQPNYQAMLHCGAVRQTVRIVSLDHPQGVLRTGDRATVEFEFISRPEFIKVGMKLLFREGKTKGLGVITRLLG